jgi:hypothetical protein
VRARARELARDITLGGCWIAIWLGSLSIGLITSAVVWPSASATEFGELFPNERTIGWVVALFGSLAAAMILLAWTRRRAWYLLAALLGGGASGVLPCASVQIGCILTGKYPVTQIVDVLHEPIAVNGWNERGLVLKNGRTLALPGITELPAKSAMLPHLLSSGVELDSQGRVFGLIRVHHWCGCDPVRKHIARVDIARVLEFVEEVGPRGRARGARFEDLCDSVGKYGWNVSCYYAFTTRASNDGSTSGHARGDAADEERK